MKPMLSCSLFLLAAAPVIAGDAPSDRMTRVENGLRPAFTIEGDTPWTLEERMRHYQVPAVSIAVINDFEVVAYRVYGLADRETGEQATTETLFQAGSISKPVAALGALKMAADGVLTLDGNVNDTLKNWSVSDNEFTTDAKVTLTHLLAHTGGLTVHGFPGYAVGEEVPTTIQVLDGSGPANTPAVRVNKVPGESYRYSGGGYTIAQLMMVDAAGKPFPELMDELVLDPVGMERSTFLNPLPPKLLKHAAAGYLPDHSAVEGKRHTYPEMAAAGLWTTAEDLARFAAEVQLALHGESDVIDQVTAEQMVEQVTDSNGRGLFLSRVERAPYFGHGGWDEGFCASLTAHRTAGYGAVVMINSNHPQLMDEIIRGIAQEFGWAGYAPHPKLDVPRESLDIYPGRYRYNAETSFTVERRGDRLFMQYAGGDAMEMHHVGEGRYYRRENLFPIMFTGSDADVAFHFINIDGAHQSHRRMADNEHSPREILIADGFDAALPVYRSMFEQSPEDSGFSQRWLIEQGRSMAAGESYEQAIGLLRIAAELYPESASVRHNVGAVYREVDQLDEARAWFSKSLEVDPDFPHALKAVAELDAERTAREHAITTRASAGRVVLTIRALIDGSDLIKVRGDQVWFEHISHSLPGAWTGADNTGNKPTIVNGVEWVPQWNGRISDVHTVEGGIWPLEVWHVAVIRLAARGTVVVVEQASEDNDWTFTLLLDDDQQPGAAWYEVQLHW